MNIDIVKNLVEPYLKEKDLILYSCKLKKEYGMNIVEVLVDSEDILDIDELAACNTYLAEKLDEYDQDWPEYMLEVSSAGAEKEIKSLEQLKKYIESYVYLESNNTSYEGKLENIEDDILSVKVNLKGRMKVYKINFNDISYIRLAVHI